LIESSIFFKGHHFEFEQTSGGYKAKIQHTKSRHPVFVELLENKVFRTKRTAIVTCKKLVEGTLTRV
jgi:hypothetical protein